MQYEEIDDLYKEVGHIAGQPLTKYSKLVVWFGCKYGIKKVLIETQHGDLKLVSLIIYS